MAQQHFDPRIARNDLVNLAEENPHPVMRIGTSGQVLYANPAAEALLSNEGWSPGRVAPARLVEQVVLALSAGHPLDFDLCCGDGRTFTFSVVPIADKGYVNLFGKDTTAIWQANKAINESREDLNRAQAVARTGSWRLDLQRNEFTWSDEACRIFGVPPGTVTACDAFMELVHPDDRELVSRRWERAMAGEPYDIEHRILVAGQVRWVRARAEVEPGSGGNVTAGFGTVQEITDLKEAEESLRASEAQFRTLVESAPHAVLMVDGGGIIRLLNRQGERMFGYTRDELIGQSVEVLVPPRVRPAHVAMRLNYQAAPEPREMGKNRDLHAVRKDGTEIPVEIGLSPLEMGNRHYTLATVVDITERKRAEEALRDSESYHRQIIALMPGFAWTTRPDGHMDFVSQQWLDFTGVPLERQLGDGWLQVVHPDDRERVGAIWQAAVSSTAPYDVEYRLRRRDGQYRWFKVRGRAIHDSAGNVTRWFGTCLDIHDLKIAEEALVRHRNDLERRVAERTAELSLSYQQLESRAEQLSRMASELTMAEQRERRRLAQVLHDHLQQLLVGARFNLEAVARQMDEARRAALHQVRDLIEESIATSRSLTVDLSPPILFQGGLSAGLGWLARWMKEKQSLEVELHVDPSADPQREDVKVLLFQAVRELLFNVVKHAGVVKVRVDMRPDGKENVRMVVSDQGTGFDPHAALQRLGGTEAGFGLFSMRERLHLIGGRLQIDSAPGRGSRVTLVAPRLGKMEPAAPRKEAAAGKQADRQRRNTAAPATRGDKPAQRQAIRVMLVDDHVVMRQGLSLLLTAEDDIEIVAEASDGQQAVELARKLRPDVVLMDNSMPRMDGVQATRIIHDELPDVRVIGLSMFEESERASAMLDAGAVSYVTKSGDPRQLLAAIRGRGTATSLAASA